VSLEARRGLQGTALRAVQLDDDMTRTRFYRDTKTQAPWRAARCVSKKEAATSSMNTARPAAMQTVMVQKSAAAIVGIEESQYRRAKQ
jgi:hypothetical protein